jgi:hypothetical protein
MKREPVHENGKLIGYQVTAPPVYITVRDMRGYESIIQAQPARDEFEPVKRQRGMFDEQD